MATQLYLFLFSFTLVLSISFGQEAEIEAIQSEKVHLLGAPVKADPQSPEIQKAAKKAVEEFNRIFRGTNYFRLTEVVSANIQVTNAIQYILIARIGKTRCKKMEAVDLEACALTKKVLNCDFNLQFHPSDEQYKLTYQKCKR
ncbi:cystatin [Polypterus senegalus]|uniref:cystatin n=1 Tax=Polypterus senegalus TaxID=55291 RepID=UPI00196401DF|nr:cystatin [Polypterus senegalus]